MSQEKKKIRKDFNTAALERDGNKCRVCGNKPGQHYRDDQYMEDDDVVRLNVHHITDRAIIVNQGYVLSNAITLCESCHLWAEQAGDPTLNNDPEDMPDMAKVTPSKLYALIGSSYEQAVADSEKL